MVRQRLSHNSLIKEQEKNKNVRVKSLVLALLLILMCDLGQAMTQVTLDLSVPTCVTGVWTE